MSYASTNDIFDAVKGQIEAEIAEMIDSVVIFDGTLTQAIDQSFNQPVDGTVVVFVGLPGSEPNASAGDGTVVRDALGVDIYVVIRASGRSRYTSNRERLWDVSDKIFKDVFVHTNRAQDFKDVIYGFQASRRVRLDGDPNFLAHRIEFVCNPATPVT